MQLVIVYLCGRGYGVANITNNACFLPTHQGNKYQPHCDYAQSPMHNSYTCIAAVVNMVMSKKFMVKYLLWIFVISRTNF